MTKHPIEVIHVCRAPAALVSGGQRAACCRVPRAGRGALRDCEIAREAGIHFSQLFRWRKELCQIEEPRTETASTLVPVVVSEAAPAAQPAALEAPAPPQPRRKRSDVTIELGRGRRVRVDSDIDTEALGRILDCVLGRR